jgi:hypothetical protein
MISRFKYFIMAISLAGMSSMTRSEDKPLIAFDLRHGGLTTEKNTAVKVLVGLTDLSSASLLRDKLYAVGGFLTDPIQRSLSIDAALKRINSTEFFKGAREYPALYNVAMNIANATYKQNAKLFLLASMAKGQENPVRIVSSMTYEQFSQLEKKPGLEILNRLSSGRDQFMGYDAINNDGTLARGSDPAFFASFIAKNALVDSKFTLVTNSDNMCKAAQEAGKQTNTAVTCKSTLGLTLAQLTDNR